MDTTKVIKADPVVIASLDSHRKRCNKDGISKWYVTIDAGG